MKKRAIIGAIVVGFYFYITWKPSTTSIVNNMKFGEEIVHRGQIFYSDWGTDSELITGYLRRVDRHYSEHFPIITYDFVITTGDYNDPEIVKVSHSGGGNYFWSSKVQPKGSIFFYHTVPNSIASQNKLDLLAEGKMVELIAKVSKNSEVKSGSGAYFKLRHSNHKILLVEDVK